MDIILIIIPLLLLILCCGGTVTVRSRFPFPTVRDDRAALALLDTADFESDELGASQLAQDRKRQDGAGSLLPLSVDRLGAFKSSLAWSGCSK